MNPGQTWWIACIQIFISQKLEALWFMAWLGKKEKKKKKTVRALSEPTFMLAN
jgi:hypothetical protein